MGVFSVDEGFIPGYDIEVDYPVCDVFWCAGKIEHCAEDYCGEHCSENCLCEREGKELSYGGV